MKKKDGSLRCCVDYRQINDLTRKDAYPLQRTDQCLDAMSGAKWFSTFDLRSSYHQVGVHERDTDKTSFICREGQFRFRTMPFGLCNAGATFQRLMDVIMSGVAFEICLCYLVDIIVYSATLEEHFARLEKVLGRLQQAGLKLKPSKCSLLQKSVEFLGHVVTEGKIGVNPAKIRDVVEWPIPISVKEVRGFVGLCSYYRRFVKDFGKIATPLTSLSEKNRKFCWTSECQQAFETLKGLLTTAPLLAMPNDVDVFILDTDASQFAIGAVLSQVQKGVERPVAYASRKLSKAEINYCVTRKELLAVVNFLKYFHHYLLGRRFRVRTDHAALQWLRRIPEPVGQQVRWIGYMEEFDFEIVHRAGNRHGNADSMSRRPCRKKDCFCSTAEEGTFCESCTGDGTVRVVKQDIGSEPIVSSVCQRTKTDNSRLVQTSTSLANAVELEDNVRAIKQVTNCATSLSVVVGSMNAVRDVYGLNPGDQVSPLEPLELESLRPAPDPPVPPDELEMAGVRCNGKSITGVKRHYNGVKAVVVNDACYGDGRVEVQRVIPVPTSVYPERGKLSTGVDQRTEQFVRQQHDRVIAVNDIDTNAETVTRRSNGLEATNVSDTNDGGKTVRDVRNVPRVAGPFSSITNDAVTGVSSMKTIGGDSLHGQTSSDGWVTDIECSEEVRAVEIIAAGDTITGRQSEFSIDVIAKGQQGDPDISVIFEMVKAGRDKPDWDDVASQSSTTKALWQQWIRLAVHNGVLCRRFEQLNGRPVIWQKVIPFNLRKAIFELVHEGMTGGHMGRKRTEVQLQNRAYWPGWSADVRRFIKSCAPCAQYYRGGPPKISSLKPFPVGEVWELVSIDVTGPHPRSRHGNVYMLTVMDHFSKWADAFPITNHTAITISRVLFNRVFVYLGVPLRLLSDQGPEFESNVSQELCRWMGIDKVRTSPYRPSTNGMVERYHRTFNTILAKVISANQRDWCEQVPLAAAAYRASVHSTTGFSPNFVMFGHENRMPVDILLDCSTEEETVPSNIDDFVEQRKVMMREVYSTVCSQLGYAASRRKERYDVKALCRNEVLRGMLPVYACSAASIYLGNPL